VSQKRLETSDLHQQIFVYDINILFDNIIVFERYRIFPKSRDNHSILFLQHRDDGIPKTHFYSMYEAGAGFCVVRAACEQTLRERGAA